MSAVSKLTCGLGRQEPRDAITTEQNFHFSPQQRQMTLTYFSEIWECPDWKVF